MRRIVWLFTLVAMVCGHPALAAPARQGPLVLAAASLQESMTAAADAWAGQGHPRPRISFAASSALARQIAAGAPADMFISADEHWMDDLHGKELLRKGTRVPFLRNLLVLVSPRTANVKLSIRPGFPLAAALGNGRLAVADPTGVPAGLYARSALTRLGVWNSVQGRLAPAENVRAALALVARGAAPLGIVYATDAKAEPAVRVVGVFPRQSHPQISYPLAVLKSSTNGETLAFRRFLLSTQGKAIFRRFGFGTP